jgi:hypothetical protein
MRKTLFPAVLLAAFAAAQDGLCPGGEIVGKGKKKDAVVEISQQITYSVTAEVFDTLSQKMIGGTPEDYGSYVETVKGRSELLVGAKVKKLDDTTYYICRADAALPYLDSLRVYLRSKLKAFSLQQRVDEESCKSAEEVYLRTLGWQRIVEHLGQMDEALRKECDRFNAKVENDCRCQGFKLHWNAGRESIYSEVAFSKLSQKLKIEKSPCSGKGISLVYKSLKHKCERAGIYRCSIQPFLSISSCAGAQYVLLESPGLESYSQKEEAALEMLQAKLADGSFWNEWMKEIKKWSPQCE